MYGIYDKTVKNMYDIYYDGIIKDAYDTEDYDVWSDASSDAYDDWSNCLSIFMMFGRICSLIFMNSNRI
jgi:hypothetical protein